MVENAYDFDLELQRKNISEIVGSLHLKAGEPNIDLISSVVFCLSSSFSLQLLPGSIIEENPILGEIKGKYSDQQINVEFVPIQWRSICRVNWKRHNQWECHFSSGSFKAEGQLNSEWLQYQNYRIEKFKCSFSMILREYYFKELVIYSMEN